jgi:hypothetical protein
MRERRRLARALQVGPLPQHAQLRPHEVDPVKILGAARDAYGLMYALLEQIPVSDLVDGLVEVLPRLSVRLKQRTS